jgi:hypothetical protein
MKIRVKITFYKALCLSIILLGLLSLVGACRTQKAKARPDTSQRRRERSDRREPSPNRNRTDTENSRANKSGSSMPSASASNTEPISSYEASHRIDNLGDLLKVRISEYEKQLLVDQFIDEADRSPYFWRALIDYIYEAKLEAKKGKANSPGANPAMESHTKTRTDNAGPTSNLTLDIPIPIDLVRFLASRWGDVILSSEPSGAEVWLDSKSKSMEGETVIKRRYPEGVYTFTLTKSGYKPTTITVTVSKSNPFEKKVVLDNQ